MSDFEDAFPLIIGGVLLIVAVGLIVWIDRSERDDLAAFHQQCLSIPKSEAECQLLLSVKRSADAAAINSGFAVGFSAASSGR